MVPPPTPDSILVVEDDAGIARLIARRIREAGSKVECVASGEEAVEWMAQHDVDLMLLDNVLPDMQAEDLLERLEDEGLIVPFIMTTGQGSETLAVDLMKRGAVDYIVKDSDFLDRLAPAVHRALQTVHQKRRLHAAEQALQQYELETRAILEAAGDGIVTFDRSGKIITANRAVLKIYDYASDEIVGAHISLLVPEDDEEVHFALPGRAATKDVRQELEVSREFEAVRKNGNSFEAEVTLSEVEGAHERIYIGVIRDVSERKSIERQMYHDAFHDKLTGLPNRAEFWKRVNAAMDEIEDGSAFAVMFIDIDRFTRINNSIGRDGGDKLLNEVGDRIRSGIRTGDTLARVGNDEFTVLLESVPNAHLAMQAAKNINTAIANPLQIGEHDIQLTACIGVAMFEPGMNDAEELIRNADVAMYKAREEGQGKVEIFDKDMHSRTVMMMKLETELRRAINQNEFVLHYQPIVNLQSYEVGGFEALIRWRRAGGDLMYPGEFIPLAEESGLICDVGRQVLHMACEQAARWSKIVDRKVVMAVNLSARQIQRENIVSVVLDVLADTGIPADCLKLELTESVLIGSSKGELEALHELKRMGVNLAIDDFGTGYSSFSYLRHMPVNTLKLDRSFVSGLPEDKDHVAITNAILAMADAMELEVIAEGVERVEELRFLVERGCRRAQGYLFSRPVEAQQAEQLLKRKLEVVAA